jgi:hypothetical protein
MPDTTKRKESESARERMREKYIMADNERHPHRIWFPLKEKTAELRTLMEGKNYVRIITEIDLNKYVLVQHYIYCEEDLWMCGDSLVLNVNPEKKILCQVVCTKTRKQCLCYDGDSHEFLTLCPNCRKIILGLKNTDVICKHCQHKVPYDKSLELPFMKLECAFCPAEIGWEEVERLNSVDKKFYLKKLNIRPKEESDDGHTS